MVRDERMMKKEESDMALPAKSNADKFTRKELDELTVKLAEVHGLI